AEDGIRDRNVTGVQTCALPISINELDTAIRYDIKTLSIVINNSLLGTIKGHQETNFPNREVGTKLSDINFAQIANVMGAYGERVTSNKEFLPALKRSLNSNKPSVLDVVTDPSILSANK